jgi:hypothetical protein
MNAPPETSPPAHLRSLAVDIPRTWTPEQALAVFDMISELRDAIWIAYSCNVQDALRRQRTNPGLGTIGDPTGEAEF